MRIVAALILTIALAGCATVPTATVGTRAQCAAWRAITYSVKDDSGQTVYQVQVHNQTGRNLRCWK